MPLKAAYYIGIPYGSTTVNKEILKHIGSELKVGYQKLASNDRLTVDIGRAKKTLTNNEKDAN